MKIEMIGKKFGRLEEVSPCKNCVNELIDKRLCMDNCPRLRAYQAGNADYKKEEIFIVPKDLVEDIESGNLVETDTSPEIDSIEEIEEDLDEEATDESKKPGPVSHIKPQPAWKKAMPVKKKKEPVQTCAICGKERTPGVKFLRGICASPCYMAWRRGAIVHPTLGVFKKVLLVEDVIATTLAEKTEPRHVAKGEVDETIDLISINLDLNPYPVISEKICRIAERLSLPISHVVFSLLGEALAEREVPS